MADETEKTGDAEQGVRPPKWKMMLVKWLGLFPPLLAIAYALKGITGATDVNLPLWSRLLIETAILVPLLNLAIAPALDSVFENWLYPDGKPKAPRADG